MARRRNPKPALLVRVLTEIGAGRITEVYLRDPKLFVHGETCSGHIRINPAHAVCDTLIHEALHRLEPGWDEHYVRRSTTFLLRRMSDEQIEQLYEEYLRLVKRPKKRRTKKVVLAVSSTTAPAHENLATDSGSICPRARTQSPPREG